MDIDGFISRHSGDWQRLDELVAAARGRAHLTAGELDELVRQYERTSTHLSIAQTRYHDPALVTDLTRRVSRAHALIYGSRTGTWRDAARFVIDEFPAAVWEARRAVLTSLALFVVPAVAVAVWVAGSPHVLDPVMPPEARELYVGEQFADYYRSEPSAVFSSWVTTNNIRVAVLAFAAGVLLCVPTVYVMAFNGMNLGMAAGLFAAAGRMPQFWGLILPHGLLELTAAIIAGGAGLKLGWTFIDPGDRPRSVALAEEGRRTVAIVIGLVAAFVVAGVIEGFVTGSPLPTWLRVGIGVAAVAAFVGYIALRGPAAAAARSTASAAPSQPPAGLGVQVGVAHQRGERAGERVDDGGALLA